MNDSSSMAESNGQPNSMPVPLTVPDTVETEGLQAVYANFVRVAGTPEELVLDFGLNSQPGAMPAPPVKIANRIVVNHFTAKRMWLTLGAALKRYEQVFGTLEVDVEKRVIPSARPRSAN